MIDENARTVIQFQQLDVVRHGKSSRNSNAQGPELLIVYFKRFKGKMRNADSVNCGF
jgi:hypothetical protein